MALIWIAMLGLVAAATQVALVFYAGQLALTAAQDGVHAGVTQDPAAARDAAQSFLDRDGRCSLHADGGVREPGPSRWRAARPGDRAGAVADPRDPPHRRQVRCRRRRAGHPVNVAPALRGERGGSAGVEAAIGAVALVGLLTFGLAVGRLTAAEAAVTEAAHAAARLGSAVRDPATARAAATGEVSRVLAQQGIACTDLTVVVAVPVVPVGDAATATARVRCSVRWADLALPGLPGRHDINAEFTSSIDRYRERS